MKKVFITFDESSLQAFLNKFPCAGHGDCRYISWAELKAQTLHLLQANNIKKAANLKRDKAYKSRFLSEYMNLISFAGKEFNSKIWWATDMASKNRYRSRMPDLLQQFLTIIEVLESGDLDYLFIIKPQWAVVSSLNDATQNMGINTVFLENKVINLGQLLFSQVRKIMGIFYHTVIILLRSCYAKIKLGKKIKAALSYDKPYYVATTFIYDHSFKKNLKYCDLFFGKLLEFLKARKNLLVYASIVGDFKKSIRNIAQCKEYAIIPFEYLFSINDIFSALREALFTKIKLKKDVFFFGHNVKEIINGELLRTFKGIQFYQFMHYWSVKRLLSAIKVETFLLTYENNPWEKMCIMALREKSVGTRILAYQMNVLSEASANLFISETDRKFAPKPDKIFTVGLEAKNIMEKYGMYAKDMIEPSCGLRFEHLFHKQLAERKISGNFLVALEGEAEARHMVDYVLQQLQNDPRYHVTIRTHPRLPWIYYAKKFGYDFTSFSNVSISNGRTLVEDISDADAVMYWGSTVSLEALSLGKPVIYFDMGTILSYDPLFECEHLKWVAEKNSNLKEIIGDINSLSDQDFSKRCAKAGEYLSRYFYPIEPEALNKFTV